MTVLAILSGAAMTIATSWALGRLALARLNLANKAPTGALAYGAGSALTALMIFAVCALQVARTPVFVVIAALSVSASLWFRKPILNLAVSRKALWLAPFLIFGLIYFVQALAPEASADGSFYHVAYPARYLEHGGFYRITHDMYANLSQAVEMLFLFAFSVGRHSSTALVHLSFLAALAAAIVAYGRVRWPGDSAAGWLAALIVFTSPVAGRDASIAYNDVAVACFAFLTFLSLDLWDAGRNPRWLLIAGLLAGTCYATKYTAGIAIPFAIGFVWWRARSLRPALIVAATAILPAAPWLIKNWVWLDNPVSPFLNRLFPNPYIHVSTEEDYATAMRNFGGPLSVWDTILETTVRGGRLQGLIGPVFLLTPLTLFGFRDSTVRRLLAAALIFLAPWFLNRGARFLIPSLAFTALALARVLSRSKAAIATIAVVQCVSAFPAAVNRYAAPHAWRISDFPWQAALRITPEQDFLDARLETAMARMIDANTPPNAVIYTALPLPLAYTKRVILLDYTSALANELRDLRWSPLRIADQPIAKAAFSFAPKSAAAIRVRHRGDPASCPGSWNVSELQVLHSGQPLSRASWTWDATFDPWKLGWAFDNNTATRWKLWRTPTPEASITVRFPQPLDFDQVRLDGTGDPANGCILLDIQNPAGGWQAVPEARLTHDAAGMDPLIVRRDAGAAMRSLGVTHLLIHRDEAQASDFDTNSTHWGVKKIAGTGPASLYELTK